MKNRETHLNELLDDVNKIAREDFDGHISMLKFTSGWKVFFGTPDLLNSGIDRNTGNLCGGYKNIADLPSYSTLKEALMGLLARTDADVD